MVEDEPGTARLMQFILAKHGYAVRVAADGAEALSAAKEFAPDAVLLDLQLPVLSGLEVLQRLRADGDADRIKIVVLTASGYEEPKVGPSGDAPDVSLSKPVGPSTLLRTLEELGVPPLADLVPA